jgi:hypothetical protein
MKIKRTYFVSIVALLVSVLFASAPSMASSRATKKFGLAVGLVTEPFPSLLGFTASYNLIKYLRLNVGYGTVSDTTNGIDVTTLEFSAKIFPLDWNFAPFASLGYSNVSGSVGVASSTIKATGGAFVYGFGIDWQTNLGFNLGFDYKIASVGGQSTALPGGYLGWYF